MIHSFWVPRAEPQDRHDPRPRQPDRCCTPTRPGRYRGQCAEFCGLQHAHMASTVVAEPPAASARWLRAQRARGRGARRRAEERAGSGVFLEQAVRELPRDPRHAGARRRRPRPDARRRAATTLAALTLPNTPRELARLDPRPAARQARQPDAGACALDGRAAATPLVAYLREPALMARRRHPGARRPRARAPRARIWADAPGRARLADDDRPQADRRSSTSSRRSRFFAAGGVEALLMRTQLLGPDERPRRPGRLRPAVHDARDDDDLPLRHPDVTGAFGNYLLPLMIGARDMAFPRLNALATGSSSPPGCFMYARFALGEAPERRLVQLRAARRPAVQPGPNIDFYALGLIFTRHSSTAAAINFIVTIFKLRAPGMSLNRMPLFCFAFLAVVVRAAVRAAAADGRASSCSSSTASVGTHFFDVAARRRPAAVAAPVLDLRPPRGLHHHPAGVRDRDVDHPDVRRRRMVAFPLVAVAELLVAFIGFGVWAHHMFATGMPTITLVFFAAASLIVVIPSRSRSSPGARRS